jgi:hypothetical protein
MFIFLRATSALRGIACGGLRPAAIPLELLVRLARLLPAPVEARLV